MRGVRAGRSKRTRIVSKVKSISKRKKMRKKARHQDKVGKRR